MKKTKQKETLTLLDNQIIDLIYKRLNIIEDSKFYGDKKNHPSIDNKNIDDLFNLIGDFKLDKNKKNSKKVLYLGPEGSYTGDAAIKKFGKENDFYSINSIHNIFEEIDKENAEFAVIPIENSLNGLVNDTLNAFLKNDLHVIGEVIIDIHHTFASNTKDTSKIDTIYSKDIAFDQCSMFLEKYNLHDVKHIYVESTTKAAKLAFENKNSAAICSNVAALNNNLDILFYDIEDNPTNKTRFFVLSKKAQKKKTNTKYKTSFIIQLPNHAGSLIEFLEKFKEANINLYKIKSHITKGISNFFIEFDGHIEDKKVKKIFSLYQKGTKILGSYKKEVEDI